MATDFTGVVLAGGRSTRMGRDKALLPWGEATLLDRMIALLRAAGASDVLVSGVRPDHAGIPDARPGLGPVGGLHAVLAHADGPVVVVPVDLPHLRPARITALCGALQASPAACFDGHPLPCALRADPATRAVLAGLLAASPGGVPMRRALEALAASVLATGGDEADLAPCNTPAQWAAVAP